MEKKLDGNYIRMMQAILNKSWRQHPTKQQLYSYLPPITKTIKIIWTRHAGHCRRNKDELISDMLPWTPSQQLCANTGYSLTSREWWTMTGGERESGRSMLEVQHDSHLNLYNYAHHQSLLSLGIEYTNHTLCRGVRPLYQKMGILGRTINYIWWWGSSFEVMWLHESPFITIILRCTLTWNI